MVRPAPRHPRPRAPRLRRPGPGPSGGPAGLAAAGGLEPAWPDTDGQQIIAVARRDPHSHNISLVLDATTANIAMHAIAVHVGDREAHIREVEHYGQNLPEDSYGRRNRQAIAARETRVAARLRAVEQAYRTAFEHDTAYRQPEPTRTLRSPERQPGTRMDLEAEP